MNHPVTRSGVPGSRAVSLAGGAGPGYERPGHDPEGDMQVARQPAQPLTGEPDYRTAAYRPPAKQRPAYDAPADVVTYGYSADPSAAAYQQQGSAFPVDAAVAYPDWTGQPEAEQPEFAPYGPPEAEPRASETPDHVPDDAPRRAARGRRRGRLWLGIGAVLVIAVAAAAVLTGRLGRSSHAALPPAAPAHALAIPQQIGTYPRDQQAEQQLGLSHGEQYVTQIDPGHVSGIVAAVYDTGGPASSPDRVAVIAGRLVNTPLADVIKSFTQQEAAEGNAPAAVPAGSLGGQAACAGRGTRESASGRTGIPSGSSSRRRSTQVRWRG